MAEDHDDPIVSHHEAAHGTFGSYAIGFVLSILFTLTPYYLVTHKVLTGSVMVITLIGFAILQLLVQLVFFLHLGRESKPRWNIMLLLFAGLVVLIVVVGSLWIMNNLNYNMMPPMEMDEKLLHDEGMHP